MMSEPSEDRSRLVDALDGYAGEIDEALGRLDDFERDLLADAPADPYEYLED